MRYTILIRLMSYTKLPETLTALRLGNSIKNCTLIDGVLKKNTIFVTEH